MGLFGLGWGDALSFALGGPGGWATYNAVNGQSGPEMPYQPNRMAPDFTPVNMFDKYTGWQNNQRNQMLADFYGGGVYRGNGKMPKEPNLNGWLGDAIGNDGFTDQVLNEKGRGGKGGKLSPWEDGQLPDATRTSYDFGGNKPVNEWMNSQRKVINSADKSFEGDLKGYFAERGMDGAGNVNGASVEQAKDFDLMRKQINAKARDIKMNTLGQLFGEVSDAGPQMAGMVGNIANTGNMYNQQAQEQYNQLLQKFQFDQANQQPNALQRIAGMGGQLLPYYLMGLGGGAPAMSGYGGYVDNTTSVPRLPGPSYA